MYLALKGELWVFIVRVLEKIDGIIMALHCIYKWQINVISSCFDIEIFKKYSTPTWLLKSYYNRLNNLVLHKECRWI